MKASDVDAHVRVDETSDPNAGARVHRDDHANYTGHAIHARGGDQSALENMLTAHEDCIVVKNLR